MFIKDFHHTYPLIGILEKFLYQADKAHNTLKLYQITIGKIYFYFIQNLRINQFFY